MIAKAGKRGTDTYGLLRYLFGPGKANEHTDPHLVAAWDPEWLGGGGAFAAMTGQRGWLATLGRDIDAVMTGHEVEVDGGHVYHVVLSVPRADSNENDGLFGDTTWRELVEDAIEHMGFGPDEDGTGGCRWVAVHHGLSTEGNDHVHLVLNLVRGDGRIADLYRDWSRWRAWCREVEDRLDLTRTAPAGEGRKATSRPELERAAKASTDTDRTRLTRIVADTAVEAVNEPTFLDLLRLAGSSLRRDLSLPRLRARWDPPPPRWDEFAVRVWTDEVLTDYGRADYHRHTWRQVTRLLQDAEAELDRDLTDSTDPIRWHQAVEQTGDLMAVLVRVEHPPAQLHRAHDQLARAAQFPRGRRRTPTRQAGVVLPVLVRAARLAAVSKDPAPLVLAGILVLLYGVIKAQNNRWFHQLLIEGVDVEYRTADGETRGDKAWLIDFQNLEMNDFLVVRQFTVRQGNSTRRADLVAFINGLPVAIIELKDPTDERAGLWKAFHQLQDYKQHIPSLFTYNEVMVISDGDSTRVGSLTAGSDRFSPWRSVADDHAPGQPSLEVLVKGLFEPRRLLDYLRYCVTFEEDDRSGEIIKKSAAYHQFRAVRSIRASVKSALRPAGDGRGGVVWHTQGSGKSLTMLMVAGALISDSKLSNPTIVVVTDRNDLENQLFSTFAAGRALVRQPPEQAESREDLVMKLNRASGGVVFTTIQKFERRGEKNQRTVEHCRTRRRGPSVTSQVVGSACRAG